MSAEKFKYGKQSEMSVTEQKSAPDNVRLIQAIQSNWQEEMEGSANYQTLADRETDRGRLPRHRYSMRGRSRRRA